MASSSALFVAVVVGVFMLHDLAEAKGRGGGTVSVRGYYRSTGTYVAPHKRSAPDRTLRC